MIGVKKEHTVLCYLKKISDLFTCLSIYKDLVIDFIYHMNIYISAHICKNKTESYTQYFVNFIFSCQCFLTIPSKTKFGVIFKALVNMVKVSFVVHCTKCYTRAASAKLLPEADRTRIGF